LNGSSGYLGWVNKTLLDGTIDGRLLLRNNLGTAFDRLQFGGITASFPALKPNGAALNVRLADDSADAALTAATAAAGTNTNQVATTAFVQSAVSPAINIWAPVDASGAGLTLTVNSARVAVLGPFVFFMFDVTYPTTASGANALVGGLPSIANGQGYGAVFYSDAATADHVLINNGASNMYVMTAAHATLTNANLSGKTLRASGWYFR
jgi:hypothetical protein